MVVGGIALIGVGLRADRDDAGGGSTAAAGSPSPTGPSTAELAAQARAKQRKSLDAALKKFDATAPEFSVAVLDKKTGERYEYRGTVKYDTASIVKVQVLACLLLHAQDGDRELTASELSLAKRMIRLSDNNATTALFEHLGKVSAVTKCNQRLGLTRTTVASSWGLTRTTADDQIKLLAELVDTKGPLDADSRKLAFTLMNSVDDTQDWGVPTIAEAGEVTTVKNGWDTRTKDGGLWAINTVGRVTSKDDDVDVSIAVLSHDNASMDSGIKLVEKVAGLTRQYLKY